MVTHQWHHSGSGTARSTGNACKTNHVVLSCKLEAARSLASLSSAHGKGRRRVGGAVERHGRDGLGPRHELPLHPLLVAPDHRIHELILACGDQQRRRLHDVAGDREWPEDLGSRGHARTALRRSSASCLSRAVPLPIADGKRAVAADLQRA